MFRRLNSHIPCAAAAFCYSSNGAAFSFSTGRGVSSRLSSLFPTTETSLSSSRLMSDGRGPAKSCFYSSYYSSFRGFAALTRPALIRVKGGSEVRKMEVPMNWGGSSSSYGERESDSLTPYVREHLTRVYTLLATGCAVAGLGSLLMIATPLAKTIPFWLPMVGGFVPLLWLSFAPPTNPGLKIGLFYAFTFLEGMAIAPLVLMTSMKGVLLTSLILTAAIFFGFSAAAYLAPRASLLAWQGPLYGALIGMVAISLINVFYPTAIAHSIVLYGGLALFSIMISTDTQAMIERARCGAGDHVQDALQMFLSVINIFVRIAQIMGSMDR